MNLKITFCALATAALVGVGCESEKHHHTNVSKEQATQIALGKVPGGTVKEGELEKEHGHWIWSFDVITPGTADITEVHVDADSGAIVKTEMESPAHEAKEAGEHKHKKHKDDDDDEKDEKK